MNHHILVLVNSYVTDRDPRRGAKFRLQLKAYARRGWKVGFVTILQRDYGLFECLRRRTLIVEETESGVPLLRDCTYYSLIQKLRLGRFFPMSDFLNIRAVQRYIRLHGRPDLIHAHGSHWAGVVANRVYHKLDIPYVITEHMSIYEDDRAKAELMPLMKEVFSAAKMRLPISESTGATLEGVFGDAFCPWQWVPNMLDDALFESTPKPQPQPQTTDTPFTFLSLSRLEPIKDFDLLLNAFAISFKGGNETLRIGGDGPLRAQLESLAHELGIASQVDFLGYISRAQVAEELQNSSAYVLSSRHETFGIPIIEAHAKGKPVVATKCGGPNSLIDEHNGILVSPGDIHALARAMQEMVARIDQYDAQTIRTQCRARFSPDAVLDRLQDIYHAAIMAHTH